MNGVADAYRQFADGAGAAASNCRYIAVLSLVKAVSLLPFGALYALSDCLFYPFYHIIRYRRRIVRRNLTESFPDKSRDEIVRIERRFYHFLTDMALESCKLMSLSPAEIRRRMKFTNIEVANDMLAGGRSVALFLGHYGNWEWVSSMALWLHGDAVAAQIYRRLRNRPMDRLMRRLRGRMGSVCVEKRGTVRFMAGGADGPRPRIIGFLADQSPRRREARHFLRFLNHEIPVLTGTEKAARHFGYKAVFAGIRRVRRGYYECELTPMPADRPDFELTGQYFRLLEQEIRRQPEFYLWTHNRFKYAIPSGS